MKRWAAFILLLAARPAVALEAPPADWTKRLHVGGNGAVRFMDGEARAQLERNSGFMVYQAGLVFDMDIAENMSFWYDFALIREGAARASSESFSREQAYVRWDNLFRREWLNLKAGRVFMPYGEEYLRWNAVNNPLASYSVAFPWALDEGVLLFGDVLSRDRLSYALTVQNGNTRFNMDDNNEKTVAVKIAGKPLSWLSASASYLNLGRQGTDASKGIAEWWLSGQNIVTVGTTTAPAGRSPGRSVNGRAYEANLTAAGALGHVWTSYGYFDMRDSGGRNYNRLIRYFAVEVLGELPKTGRKGYLAGRFSTVGTYHPERGYAFAGTELAGGTNNSSPYSNYNFDQRDLTRCSLGGGWRMTDRSVLKAEYSWETTHLIEPAKTPSNMAQRDKRDFLIFEAALKF